MYLQSTDSLLLITSAAHEVDVHVSYVDRIGKGKATPGRQNTKPVTATTTTILAGPADTFVQRDVEQIDVVNADASNANIVTVEHTDGTTIVQLFSVSLAHGDSLHYTKGAGWVVRNAAGAFVNST